MTGKHGREKRGRRLLEKKRRTNGGRQLLARRIRKTKGQQLLLDLENREERHSRRMQVGVGVF